MSRGDRRSFENYKETCSRIIGYGRDRTKSSSSVDYEKLSFKDIQNITKSMIKDKKVC